MKQILSAGAVLCAAVASFGSDITIERPELKWLFGGFGFQNAEAQLTPLMSDAFRNERAVKSFRELSPSFSRVYVGMVGESKEALDRFADYYDQTFRHCDTTIYAVGGSMPAFPEKLDVQAHAEGVAKSLEYLVKKRDCRKIRFYCLTNELMSGDQWAYFWFQKKMPLFKAFHEALYDAFRRHGLDIQLAASDGSYGRSQAEQLKWTVENMDLITGVYCTHYYDGLKPGDPEAYGIFYNQFTNVVKLAIGRNKRWMLGEFGVMPPRDRGVMVDDRNWNGYDPAQAGVAALTTAEMAMAAVNAGAYAVMSWSFCDYPDPFVAEDSHDPVRHACYESAKAVYKPDMKYNKWGVFRWSDVKKDYGPNPTYFTLGMMSRYFRKGANVLNTKIADPLLRATVLENRDGSQTMAIVNLGPKRTVTVAGWESFPRLPRLYLYDSAKPFANRFGDLPQPDRTVPPAGEELRVEIPEKGMAFLTTDYLCRRPPVVTGLVREGLKLRWEASKDPDHCYYRVYADGRQVASTVATSYELESGAEQIAVASVDRWGNPSDVVFTRSFAVTAEKPFLLVPGYAKPVACTTFARNLGYDLFDLSVGGMPVASYTADARGGDVTWHSPIDLTPYVGKDVTLVLHGADQFGDEPLKGFRMGSRADFPSDLGDEPYRPQFHFTPTWGWSNDPNGLSYYNGQWHVFYQSVACSALWRPSNGWRHAASRDLVHWTDQPPAIEADAEAAAWSGSIVTDEAGRQHAFYTRHHWAGGHSQATAVSKDGVTFEKRGDVLPKVDGDDRDPFVFYHKPTGAWKMLVYQSKDGKCTGQLYTSKDLKDWTWISEIVGDTTSDDAPQPRRYLNECPFMTEVPVEGTSERRWIVGGGSLAYRVGTFDGTRFTPTQEPRAAQTTWIGAPGKLAHFLPYYAGQVFNGAPDGRVVYLAWYKLEMPEGARFSQAMGLPLELTLAKDGDEYRLRMQPVKELDALRDGAATELTSFRGELAEIEYAATVGKDAKVTFDLRGHTLVFDAAAGTLASGPNVKVPWKTENGRLALRLYVDRAGLEVFSQDGFQLLPDPTAKYDAAQTGLSVTTSGSVTNVSSRVWKLRSARRAD